MVNIRTKGASGEREVATAMNEVVQRVLQSLGYPPETVAKAENLIQRNQNQSAVGGSDLSNTFGLAVEIKRQENLAINTWWKQTVASAQRNAEIPVLIYRQSRKPWMVILNVSLFISLTDTNAGIHNMRGEISFEDFIYWFENYVRNKFVTGQTHGVRL